MADPLPLKIPAVRDISLQTESGEEIVSVTPVQLTALLREAQKGVDLSDNLQTQVWTGRFATLLTSEYGHPFTASQAWLIADAANTYWARLVESFRNGLR